MDGIFNVKFPPPLLAKKKIKPDDLHRQSGKIIMLNNAKHLFVLLIYKANRKNTDGNFLMQNSQQKK